MCESLVLLHLCFLLAPAFQSIPTDQIRLMKGLVETINEPRGLFLQVRFFSDIEKIRRMQREARADYTTQITKDDYKVFEVRTCYFYFVLTNHPQIGQFVCPNGIPVRNPVRVHCGGAHGCRRCRD